MKKETIEKRLDNRIAHLESKLTETIRQKQLSTGIYMRMKHDIDEADIKGRIDEIKRIKEFIRKL